MDFDSDLFISYAHIDNQSLTDAQARWISTFHTALEIRLWQLLGREPNIWRDKKLQGNDYFSDAIHETLANSALLVSILSPRYRNSEWCIRELQAFCREATQQGGIKVGDNKSRLFKVVKTHLPREQHPPEFEGTLGYEFYEFDEAGRPKEFDKLYGPELERKFYNRLNDLAYDIHQALQILESLPDAQQAIAEDLAFAATQAVSGQPVSGKTIYLAETSYDLQEARDKIRRELTMEGHRVLPAQPLSLTPDFTQQVRENLAQCQMAIHLVSPQGAGDTETESASEKAFQQLLVARSQEQIELSANCCQAPGKMSRIIWMPPNAKLGKTDTFLKSLQSQPDFLSTPLEILKTLIEDRLAEPEPEPEPEFESDQASLPKVYLDCDQRDLDAPEIEPLYDWLEQRFEVVLPGYDSNSLSHSESLLKQCEAVLIYYGRANGLWLRRRLSALKKTLYDRPKPLLTQAVYLAGPTTPNKQSLAVPDMTVIDGQKAFEPGLLQPFLEPLQEVSR